jgi:mycothiol maleylpyruvate isomerase-like protein/MDMPI-like protein
VADLTRHVGEVYLHKTLAMREGAEPDPWPPEELADEDPLALLDRAYATLTGEFAARKPTDPAGSWYAPDQTVGFWIRRMAQETVIHRIDAELGTGQPVAPVPADLAVDGIDELLKVFVAYSVAEWGSYFTDILAGSPGRTYTVRTDGAAWRARTGRGLFTIEDGPGDDAADVTVSGPPTAVLRWVEPGELRRAEQRNGRGHPGGGRGTASLHRHSDAVMPVSQPPVCDGGLRGGVRRAECQRVQRTQIIHSCAGPADHVGLPRPAHIGGSACVLLHLPPYST